MNEDTKIKEKVWKIKGKVSYIDFFCIFAIVTKDIHNMKKLTVLFLMMLPLATVAQTAYEMCEKGIECYDKHQYDEAEKWFLQGADRGDARSMYHLGKLYEKVHFDVNKAFSWYMKSANKGYAPGLCQAGNFYKDGRGCEKSYSKAIEYYTKAADMGDAGGLYYLGNMYYRGYGVTLDYNKAHQLFLEAAAQNSLNAQYYLGEMYARGQGVKKDYAKAIEWFEKAIAHNDSFATSMAKGRIADIRKKMAEGK